MNPIQPDPNGVWHIGRSSKGCKHCGKTQTHHAKNGKATWTHPGVTCCRKAVEDQHKWRRADLENARNEFRKAQRAITDLEDKVNRATGAERNLLNIELNKARAALPFKRDRLLLQVDGDPTAEIIGIKNEIRELEAKLNAWPA